jgi:hypothetical protein
MIITMKKTFFAALAIIAMASCSNDDGTAPVEYGKINLSITQDEPKVEVETRTSDSDYDNYTVNIYYQASSSSTKENKFSGTYSTFKSTEYSFATGSGYSIDVESCTADAAKTANDNYGQKRIAGSSTFSIASGTNDVTVSCTMANSQVSVVYDASFTSNFTDYDVEFYSASSTDRVLKNSTGKDMYFPAGETIMYKITGKFNGTEKTYSGEGYSFTSVAAKNHKLTVKATASGKISLGITVTDTVTDTTEEVEVNPYATTTTSSNR